MNETDKEVIKSAIWCVVIVAAFCLGIWAMSQVDIQIS